MENIELSATQIIVVLLVMLSLGISYFYETKKETGHRFPIVQTCVVLSIAMLTTTVIMTSLYRTGLIG